MKRIYLLLVGAFALFSWNVQAGEHVLFNFQSDSQLANCFLVDDSGNKITSGNGFTTNGLSLISVPTPASGALTNNYAQALTFHTDPGYAGGWMNGILFNFDTPVTSDTYRYLHIAIKAPAGAKFNWVVNNNWGDPWRYLEFYPPNGEWFDYVIDLAGGRMYENSQDPVEMTSLLISIDMSVSGNIDQDFYFGEIALSTDLSARTVIPTPIPTRLSEYNFLPIVANFEAGGVSARIVPAGSSVILKGTDGIDDNPLKTTLNNTNKVVHISTNNESTAEWTRGFFVIFDKPFIVNETTNKYLHILMKSNLHAPKLYLNPDGGDPNLSDYTQNPEWWLADNWNDQSPFSADNTKWYDLVFDLTAWNGGRLIGNAVKYLRFDIDPSDSGNRNKDLYLDEICINSDGTSRSAIPAYGTWTGLAGDGDWNNSANWTNNVPPFEASDVYLPAGLSSYPALDNNNPFYSPSQDADTYNDCHNITLEYGANIENPGLLNYAGATMLIDINALKPGTIPDIGAASVSLDKLTTTFTGAMNLSLDVNGCDANYINLLDNTDGTEIYLKGEVSLKSATDAPIVVPVVGDVNSDRFEILYANDVATSLKDATSTEVKVYREGDVIRLQAAEAIQQVFVYNTQGMLLYANTQVGKTTYAVGVVQSPSISIVKVVTASGVKTVKLK
ncbi:MAG: hypothetical protein FWD60_01790 [Candidatus Azobacteroides sp.]|nr:hypothetical protein [Candidatus Azobacteroides sp.]